MGGHFEHRRSTNKNGSIGHLEHLLDTVLLPIRDFVRGADIFLSAATLLPRYSTTTSLDRAM